MELSITTEGNMVWRPIIDELHDQHADAAPERRWLGWLSPSAEGFGLPLVGAILPSPSLDEVDLPDAGNSECDQ
jgi:hypothetical protein